MGISHRAEPSIGCTFDVWDGEVSDDDLCHHLVRLAEDNAWPAGHAHLTDLSTLVSAPVPDPQVLDALYDGTSLGHDLEALRSSYRPVCRPTPISRTRPGRNNSRHRRFPTSRTRAPTSASTKHARGSHSTNFGERCRQPAHAGRRRRGSTRAAPSRRVAHAVVDGDGVDGSPAPRASWSRERCRYRSCWHWSPVTVIDVAEAVPLADLVTPPLLDTQLASSCSQWRCHCWRPG